MDPQPDVPELDPAAAATHHAAGDAVFLDIRDPASFAEARVPGAVHASDATIASFLERTDRAQRIVVYCYHGNSSLGGAAYLQAQGFSDVYSLRGGFEAWRASHPVEP